MQSTLVMVLAVAAVVVFTAAVAVAASKWYRRMHPSESARVTPVAARRPVDPPRPTPNGPPSAAPMTTAPARSLDAAPAPRAEASQPSPAVAESGEDEEWLVAGAVQMSLSTGEVWRGNRRVQLTDGQREVLRLLLTEGDQGLTAAEVLAAAGRSPDEGSGAADRLIAQLVRRVGLSSSDGEGVRTERTHVYYLDRLE